MKGALDHEHLADVFHIFLQRDGAPLAAGCFEGGREVGVVVGCAARLQGGGHAGGQVGVAVVAVVVAVCVNVAGAADDLDVGERTAAAVFCFCRIVHKRAGVGILERIARGKQIAE